MESVLVENSKDKKNAGFNSSVNDIRHSDINSKALAPDTVSYKMVSKPVENIQMKCEECEEEEKIRMKPEDPFSFAGGADEGQKQKTQDQHESLQMALNDSISSESKDHNGVTSMSSQAKQMSPEPSHNLQMKCEECEEEERIQMKPEVIRKAMAGANVEGEEDDPTSHFLQAKLKIGAPNDKYEQEADRVADQVMRMPDSTVQRQTNEEEEEEPVQTKSIANSITPLIQRQPEPEEDEEAEPEKEEEEEPIQTKSIDKQSSPVTTGLHNKIQSLKGGGQPLPKSARAFLEPRFGADFSSVRVHSDSSAAHISRSINARAFTHGHDVVFGAGQYSPETSAGKKLIAHELTHVVQQEGCSQGGDLFQSASVCSAQAKSG